LVSLLFLFVLIGAPFPKNHEYNAFNTMIDPSWSQLDDDTQTNIYKSWLSIEPKMKAMIDYAYKKDREAQAEAEAWKAAFELVTAKAKALKGAFFHNEQKPPNLMGLDTTPDEKGASSTETRYKTQVQFQWEKFQAAFQHAVYLRMAQKRALYQILLEKARYMGNKKFKQERKLLELKKNFDKNYLKQLEKFKRKFYKALYKLEDFKMKVKESLTKDKN